MQNLEVQEPMPYVWLFVAHSVGQFVGAPLIARYLRGGRIVPAVVFGAFAIIVGNGLFWFFSINQYGWGMGGGRVVCGVGGAVATASYGHIVRHSNRSVRIGRIRAFRSVDVTMRILGLALGALFGVIFPDELFLGLKNSNAGALVTISAACVILSLSNVQNCCADPTEQRR
jgi:MFS family permease